MNNVEAAAYALLQQHCGVLNGRLMTPKQGGIQFYTPPCTYVVYQSFQGCCGEYERLGLSLRLALDIVNACCACEQLDPATNPRFWHHVTTSLWSGGMKQSCLNQLGFGASIFGDQSFASYTLLFFRPPVNACLGFWRGFFQLNRTSSLAVRCQAGYQDAIVKLHPHMTTAIRRLTIAVIADAGSNGAYDNDLHRLGSQWSFMQSLAEFTNDPHNTVDLELLLSHGMNGPHLLRLGESWDLANALAAGPRLAVSHMEVVYSPARDNELGVDAVRSQITTLGALLRVAFIRGKGKSLRIPSTSRSSYRYEGAIFSIVAHATHSMTLECTNLFFYTSPRLLKLAWLVYATHHPHRSPNLAIRLTAFTEENPLNDNEIQYIQELLRTQIPLRDVVFAAVEERYTHDPVMQVECFSFGSMILVAQGTTLYFEPGRQSVEYAVTVLTRDECVDVIAHIVSEACVGVVYPGYGLVWVHESSATWVSNVVHSSEGNQHHDQKPLVLEQTTPRPGLSSFSIRYGSGRMMCSGSLDVALLFVGSTLTTIDLHGTHVSAVFLEGVLRLCPQLQSLDICASYVESLLPLVCAYTSLLGCRVSSLSLMCLIVTGPPEHSFAGIFHALAQPAHPMPVIVRELYIDLRLNAGFDLVHFNLLVHALEQPRVRLRRVSALFGIRGIPSLYAPLLRLTGRLLSDPSPPVILATLGVLRVRAPSVCDEDIARTVLWFVGGSVEQSLTWD